MEKEYKLMLLKKDLQMTTKANDEYLDFLLSKAKELMERECILIAFLIAVSKSHQSATIFGLDCLQASTSGWSSSSVSPISKDPLPSVRRHCRRSQGPAPQSYLFDEGDR